MSSVLKGVGKVAGIVLTIAKFAPLGPVGLIAATAGIIAMQAFASKKPVAQGSVTQVQIGANMPSPCLIGESYYGGSRVHQTAYGSENGVPNAIMLAVDVYSVGGPVQGIVQEYADFDALSFAAGAGSTAETGYYSNDTLYRDVQLGATPEGSVLGTHWGGAPDWGSGRMISGKAAIAWNARRPKDGKRFAAGFPQVGAVWQGVLAYDPRLDSTRPGGSGSHRWAAPADAVAFAAAKATWSYSRNPGLHALRYALGSWEADDDGVFQKIFGVGGSIDQLVLEDFTEAANVADANGWTVNGVVFEGPSLSKWDNLKRIGLAGGFEPCFKGARLGLSINAPRVAADTITLEDIGEGTVTIDATTPRTQRKNTLNPYFISADHKWESVPTTPVQKAEYLTEDGGKRSEDVAFDLVTDADQACQLTGYDLVNRREQPFSMPVIRRLPVGVLVAIDAAVRAKYGLRDETADIRRSRVDLAGMRFSIDLRGESAGKHDFALALTGSTTAPPSIPGPEDYDDAASSGDGFMVTQDGELMVTQDGKYMVVEDT